MPSVSLEVIKRELAKKPDLGSKDDNRRWLFFCIHAFHLRLITKKRLNQIGKICKTALLGNCTQPGVKDDYISMFKMLDVNHPLYLSPDTWKCTFSRSSSKRTDHHECVDCGFCSCCCGKAHDQFKEDREIKRLDSQWSEIAEWYRLTKVEVAICREYRSKCLHGRWGNLECDCSLIDILAMFKLRQARFRIPKRHRARLWDLTAQAQIRYSLSQQQLKQLRRHLLLCDYAGQHSYTGQILLCTHSPMQIIELMANSPT